MMKTRGQLSSGGKKQDLTTILLRYGAGNTLLMINCKSEGRPLIRPKKQDLSPRMLARAEGTLLTLVTFSRR